MRRGLADVEDRDRLSLGSGSALRKRDVPADAVVDVMTSDRFAARLSIRAEGRITDARAAVEGQHQHGSRLSAAAFEAAAAVAAWHTLESLFAERAGLSDQLTARLAGRIPELALERVA